MEHVVQYGTNWHTTTPYTGGSFPVNELWCTGFRSFIITHFIITVSHFHKSMHRSLSAQTSLSLRPTAFVLYGMRFCVKHSMYFTPQKVFYIKNKLTCFLYFLRYFMFPLLVFHKFLEPNKCFICNDSEVCDGSN